MRASAALKLIIKPLLEKFHSQRKYIGLADKEERKRDVCICAETRQVRDYRRRDRGKNVYDDCAR